MWQMGRLDVISPGYRFVNKHAMTRGDPYWEWIIEKK